MQKLILASILFLSTISTAQLLPGVKLGEPSYGGTGCPAGTASVSLSPDQDEISILFDQFITEAGGATGRMVDRKACELSVPLHIPQGYSATVIQTDFRGFNLVSRGGMNRLNTEYFWAGMRGPSYSNLYRGPQNEDYFATNGVVASGVVWTPCGMSTNLRIRATIMTQTNRQMDQSMMTVDSADITGGLIYHIQWRKCR
ncbi:MAG: DUF4360 domain-containing protein [Bdellovibrionales bacterium]